MRRGRVGDRQPQIRALCDRRVADTDDGLDLAALTRVVGDHRAARGEPVVGGVVGAGRGRGAVEDQRAVGRGGRRQAGGGLKFPSASFVTLPAPVPV